MFTYYTYGGFQSVSAAFQNCAAIFGSADHKGAITAFVILGIMAGAAVGYLKVMFEGANPLTWFYLTLIGMVLYLGLFVPKVSMEIFDPVYNQDVVVADLPLAVVLIAETANLIEQIEVNISDSTGQGTTTACGAMPPMQYQTSGGTVAPQLLATTASSFISDANYARYIQNYVQDCLTFELLKPGTTTTIDNVMEPGCGVTILDTLGKAANPAVFTADYQNNPISCQQAYTAIQSYYTNPANASAAALNACGGSGFSDQMQCQSLIQTTLNNTLGVGIDPMSFISQQTVANITSYALASGNAESVQLITQLQQGNINSGVSAGITNPQMINIYLAYVIMIIPFISLVMATCMWRKVFALLFGFLFFVMIMRGLDVIAFRIWATFYQSAMASAFNNSGIGGSTALALNTKIGSMLSNLGIARASISTFATIISGTLFHFTDQGLARLQMHTASKNEQTDHDLRDPGRADMRNQEAVGQRAAMVASLASGVHGMSNYAEAAEARISGATGDALGAKAAGGGTPGGLQASTHQASTVDASTRFSHGANLTSDQAARLGANNAMREAGAVDNQSTRQAYENAAVRTLQDNAQGVSAHQQAQRIQQALGLKTETEAYKVLADFNNASGEATAKAFGGDRESYAKFLEGTQNLAQGERDAVMKAANAAGMGLREFAGNRAAIDKMKDVGMLKAIQNGQVSDQDLQEMGRAGILSDAGRMDTWQHTQQATGMDPRQATAFMGAHSNIDSIEKFKNFEAASAALGSAIASGDYKALADSYAQKNGSQERILTRAESNALNAQMHAAGHKDFHSKAGDAVRFGYDASTGSITMAHTTGGGKSEHYNLDSKRSGHDFEKINRDVTTVDKGLRETAGTFIKTGYDNQNFNQTAKHGTYMMQIGGKEMEVKGDLYYGKDGKLIGGTVENGINQSVLAYQMDKDGRLHYAQVSGKADTNGNLVAGKTTEITEQEFVRNNEHGAAIVSSRGTSGQPDVDVKGSGGVKLDQSNTSTFGNRVESKQNLAGSAAQGAGFGQDGNINPGTLATTIAIGQGALHETGQTLNDVKNLSRALRDPETVIGKPGKEGRAAANKEVVQKETRAAEEAARAHQVKTHQANQKTVRILQNQSRTSQVPHGRTMPRPASSSVRPGNRPSISRPGSGKFTPK
ncbi:conjugal transfer protein TraG [Geobacter sp. FeAm09]|uniref:conjugal transfer protein TraG N-terminal domain-containing protein n=1 Tax=Geobacter sp. FeAm09 TaxID=2597769 RepID=UPI0011ED712E|nr:conjugal transfer protein TraG N-terminal domain-containing protein [Geobacter sp. FeAm09]QEM66743.1 conjugal transfer protein TraG [Geobacter sp. FeAm09]